MLHASCDLRVSGQVDGEAGKITYTQWLCDQGRLQADLTVTKLSDDSFMVVATDTAHRHVEAMLKRGASAYASAHPAGSVSSLFSTLPWFRLLRRLLQH